jgi:hypothetical protein
MNEQQIRLKLSRLPGDKLTRVAVMAQGVAEGINSKEDAVNVLTSRIIDDRVTLDAVLAAVSHQPTQAAPVAGPDPRLDEALVNIQDRLQPRRRSNSRLRPQSRRQSGMFRPSWRGSSLPTPA